MNKVSTKLLLLLLAPFLFLLGCEEEEEVWRNDPPKVAFSVAETALTGVNLDRSAGPRITGTVQSDAGLQEVVYEVITKSGREVVETITTFDEVTRRIYVIDYLPEYTADVVGFRVLATDVEGREAGGSVNISALGGTQGPTISLPSSTVNANIRPNVDERPAIEGTVSSHWGLASINFFEVYEGGGEETAGEITSFGDTPNTYNVNVTPDYRLGMTGFRVVAVDQRGNASEHTVPVNVIDAAAAPTIAFEEESIEADLTVSPSQEPAVTGTIEASEGIASVSFYLVSGDSEEQFGETITTFDDPELYNFNVQPPYRFGATGIRVEVQDAAGQTVSETLPLTVTAEDTDLTVHSNVVLSAQANRDDPTVATAYSVENQQAYSRQEGYDDPEVAAAIDFITVDSGGNDELDLFSPSHTGWLEGNYFNEFVWANRNVTRMEQLDVDDPEAFFNNATSASIRDLELGTSSERVDPLFQGDLVLFETATGHRGLLYFKNHDPNAEIGSKADIFTFDIKSVEIGQ